MTDTQLYLAVGMPCLTVLASLIATIVIHSGQREALKELREDIREIRSDIKQIVAHLATIDLELGKLMDRH
jgi:hypothetical protein